MKSPYSLRVALITVLFSAILPAGAFAVPYDTTLTFVASNIINYDGSNSPHAPVSGSFDVTVDSATKQILSLNGISLVLDGYAYQLSEVGVYDANGGGAIGGTVNEVAGVGTGIAEDFALFWWGGSILDNVGTIFVYAHAGTNDFFISGNPVSIAAPPAVSESPLGFWFALPVVGLLCLRLRKKWARD